MGNTENASSIGTPINSIVVSTTSAEMTNIKRARVLILPDTNINSATLKNIQLGSFEMDELGATISGGELTGLSGDFRFIVQIQLDANSTRPNFKVGLRKNGVIENEVAGPFYARNASNHDDTGAPLIFEVEGAAPTDIFGFYTRREAGAGDVDLTSNGTTRSHVFIEQYEKINVITSVTT